MTPNIGHAGQETPKCEMTPGRAALVSLMYRYLGGLLDPVVTLLEVHKLMYFLQVAGEPLRLNYQKAQYGPYAENLRHVLREVEGHLISGYADGGEAPGKLLELVPAAVEDSQDHLATQPATRERLARVVELIDGFESPFGLELLSTVHWVATENPTANVEEIIELTYAWDPRKRQFSPRQIGIALRALNEREWIPSA